LNEFQKVSCLHHLGSAPLLFEYLLFADAVLVASVLSGEAGADANQWAQDVLMAVRDLDPQEVPMALKPVLALASEYLTHLLIAGLSCIMKLTCHLLYHGIQ
jgi:hypothetical protein